MISTSFGLVEIVYGAFKIFHQRQSFVNGANMLKHMHLFLANVNVNRSIH